LQFTPAVFAAAEHFFPPRAEFAHEISCLLLDGLDLLLDGLGATKNEDSK
jgi:hypothetical protein